jgi:fumarate hydratase class I
MKRLFTPLTAEAVSSLALGEAVALSGRIYTARDAAHKHLVGAPATGELPSFEGAVLYHCGPVVIPSGDKGWEVTAAGPTTSIREEPYEAEVIRRYGIRAIIGKGGMGEATVEACRECGCVYLSAVGGAAQILANAIRRVCSVRKLEEFGAPEAIWELEVDSFPAVVTIDVHGNSLHRRVREQSAEVFRRLCP